MAYLIDLDEPAGKAIRRVLREQNERVLALLMDWESDPADSIHRARQGCKRARAVAQLIKPSVPYVAVVENSFYRDIQQRLGYARDAEALVEALDYLEIGVDEPQLAESVGMLREAMASRAARDLEQDRQMLQEQISSCCSMLRDADGRLARIPLADLRRRDLRRGADRKWERCAVDFAALRSGSPPQAYHAWRRQVKYAANQTQLLASLSPARAMIIGPRLRELASLLGQAQDLDVLGKLIHQQPDALGIDTHVQRLRQLIETSLARLRHRALEMGGDLFRGEAAPAGESGIPPVTEPQHSGNGTATPVPEDALSRVRRMTSERGPYPSRRRYQR